MHDLLEYLPEHTRLEIQGYLDSPTHAVLIETPKGFGADELSKQLAEKLDNNFSRISPKVSKTGSLIINVSMIRQIYRLSAGKKVKNAVIIVESADNMTTSAQNAFLKLLEEPSLNTLFILSTEDSTKILNTVKSRSRIIKIDKISRVNSERILKANLKDRSREKQVLFLSVGLPMELIKMCENDDYFSKRSELIRDSMTMVSGSVYDKLKVISKHKENRQSALKLIDDSLLIVGNTLPLQRSEELVSALSKLLLTRDLLVRNANVRLSLMKVVL